MSHSPAAIERFKNLQWRLRRQYEERAQESTVRWWLLNHNALGVADPRVLFANGSWLGKPNVSAFFIIRRLHALGWYPESPRLTLAVPRSHSLGLFLWFKHPESPESSDAAAMKSALAAQGYDVAILKDAESAIARIAAHMTQ